MDKIGVLLAPETTPEEQSRIALALQRIEYGVSDEGDREFLAKAKPLIVHMDANLQPDPNYDPAEDAFILTAAPKIRRA